MSTPLDEIVCATIDGEPLSLRAVLRQAVRGGYVSFIDNAIHNRLIDRAVKRLGITVTREDYERMLRQFRTDSKLESPEALSAWLAARSMSEADLESQLREVLAFGKLKETLIEAKVEPYFHAHEDLFRAIVISTMVLEDRAKASSALERIKAGERFSDMARALSIDHRTKLQGGFIGRVRRREVDPAHADALFAAIEGAIVGPLVLGSGPASALYQIERVLPAALDSLTRSEIHTLLFAEWLDGERKTARVEIPLVGLL